MAISVVQTAKNSSAYQVKPLTVTLPAGTAASSYLVVVVEAQKSGYPYNLGSLGANIPNPIITDDKSNIYTTVDSVVGVTQEVTSGVLSPDAAGYFPSAYVYITAAATGTQNVSVAAFYPDEYTSPIQPGGNLASPPNVNGRPVFDGGTNVQVFELAGVTTGVDKHGHGTYSNVTPIGAGLFTTSAIAGLILEVGLLIDSSTIITDSNSTSQHSSILGGGSTHFVVQTRITTGATANAGFGNALKYSGAVVAVSVK
jgi:hypothetical protein